MICLNDYTYHAQNTDTVAFSQKSPFPFKISTQQNSYSISHLLRTVTTLWRDSDSAVTAGKVVTELHANGSVVTVPKRWPME